MPSDPVAPKPMDNKRQSANPPSGLQPEEIKIAIGLTGDCMTQQRRVDSANDKIADAQRAQANTKAGQRYRRRGVGGPGSERQRLQEIEDASKDAAEQKKQIDEELKQATANKDQEQKGLNQCVDKLRQQLAKINLADHPDFGANQSFYSIQQRLQDRLDALEQQKKDVVKDHNDKWLNTIKQDEKGPSATILHDRDMDKHLFQDITSCTWMVNPASGQSSSQILQRLEFMQRELENGSKDADLQDYKDTTGYFLYSETRSCCIKLKKVASNPAKWDYEYYYQPKPLADVVAIFKKCKGRDVAKLREFQDKLKQDEFADVVM